MQVATVGLDLAKNVFHVHGITDDGEVVFSRPLRRAQVVAFFERLDRCLIGMEACGTSHHWARELLRLGHDVRLIPPAYVKPYVKRGKSDAADAEAICEAVMRPTMRFVEVKSSARQAILAVHRARDLVVRQRTQTINMLRSVLAEFGIIFARGVGHAIRFARCDIETKVRELPTTAREIIVDLCRELLSQHDRVAWYSRKLVAVSKEEPEVRLLRTIPGIGPVTASAIAATIGTARQFSSGRDFAAWLGLTPLNRSTGGKERLGRISKMGDRYIRRLLVLGMTSRIRQIRSQPAAFDPWFSEILSRKPAKLAAVAMANKTARIIWAVLTREEPYRVRTI
jgi:transposase